MSQSFDLRVNFPVDQLEKDAARAETAIQKVGTAAENAANKALNSSGNIRFSVASIAQSCQAAMQTVAAGATQAQQAYNQFNATLQQVNATLQQIAKQKGPQGPAQPNQPGQQQPGGGGGNQGGIPGFGQTLSPGSRGALQLFGMGGGAYAGYQVIRQITTELANLLPQAAQAARALQNVSQEFGLSAQEMYKLQTAAKLVGVDMGNMAMAARKLSEAIEEPGSAGKKTAAAMGELGVSLRQGVGGALEDTIHKLADIQDPTKQAQMAFELFGRSGAQILIVAQNLKQSEDAMRRWGLALDTDVQRKLVDANAELEAFSAKLTLLKAQAASGIILPIFASIANMATGGDPNNTKRGGRPVPMSGMGGALSSTIGNMLEAIYGTPAGEVIGYPKRPGSPDIASTAGNPSRLLALLGDNSKIGIEEQLVRAKAELAKAEAEAGNDANVAKNFPKDAKAPGQSTLDEDAQKVSKLRAEVLRLEAAKKAAGKADMFPEKLAEMKDRIAEIINGEKGPLAAFDHQFAETVRKLNLKPGTSRYNDYAAEAGIVRSNIYNETTAKDAKELQRSMAEQSKTNAELYANLGKFHTDSITNGLKEGDPLITSMFGVKPGASLPPWFSATQNNDLARMLSVGSTRVRSTVSGPGEQGHVAAENLNSRLEEIQSGLAKAIQSASELPHESDQLAAKEKARFEAAKEGIEASIQYEQELASIRKQQLQETRNFVSGLFNAAISRQPGATANYMRNFGMHMADTIVGNAGANLIGTLNSRLTLQSDQSKAGILGHPNAKGGFDASPLGKLLEGTPFGIDPAKGGKVNGLQTATEKNTGFLSTNNDLLDKNNQLIGDLVGLMGRMTGVDTGSLPGMGTAAGASASAASKEPVAAIGTDKVHSALGSLVSSIGTIGKAIEGHNPAGIISAIQRTVGGPGMTSGITGKVALGSGSTSATSAAVPVTLPRSLTDALGRQAKPAETAKPTGPAKVSPDATTSGDTGTPDTTGNIYTDVPAASAPASLPADIQPPPYSPPEKQVPWVAVPKAAAAETANQQAVQTKSSGSAGATITQDSATVLDLGAQLAKTIKTAAPQDARTPSTLPQLPAVQDQVSHATLPPFVPLNDNEKVEPLPSVAPATVAPPEDAQTDTAISGLAAQLKQALGISSANTNDDLSRLGRPDFTLTPPTFGGPGNSTWSENGPVLPSGPATTGPLNLGYNPANSPNAASDTSNTISTSSKLGQIFGGQSGPAGLHGALTGTDANGDPLSGYQRAGDMLATGAQVAGGAFAAYQGFSKGGARGDLQGIAGTAAAIAPFTGPAAPFIEAGAAITGLISTLLPDPRQERIKQEQRTVTGDAFIQPASRDYTFAAGGGEGSNGGFSLGSGSSLRSGGQTANYNVNIQALDANSFINWANSNPQAAAQVVLAGISQGNLSQLDAEIAWRSQYGGSIPQGW